jgi:hypothetical protein
MLNINKINDKIVEYFDQNQDQHTELNLKIQKITFLQYEHFQHLQFHNDDF